MNELPFQTFERITDFPWPGGRSAIVIGFLRLFRITEKPGSAEANLMLQKKMLQL